MSRTEPRTERGHRWHVHATYDKSGTIAPIAGTKWYEQVYGMRNWDFDSEEAAIRAFLEKSEERLGKGYEVREGGLPERPFQSSGMHEVPKHQP